MQAERIINRSSLHSVWDYLVKTSGSLSIGRVDHFQRGQHGSVSFGISKNDYGRFAKILMKYLTKAAGNCTEALEDYAADGSDILPLIDGCGLVKEGLVVYFYPYTLSAGNFGQFNAVIPLTALRGILKQR